MAIENIHISNFRNIYDSQIGFSEDLNLIFGDNGSGKTSLLESIYFLSRGKSFLTNKSNNLINIDEAKFILFGKITNGIKIGIQKQKNKKLQIKINEKNIYQLSSLAQYLALQVITTECFQLIDSSPAIRRRYIDWIVFHVKHDLIKKWKEYRLVSSQRNSALKNQLNVKEIRSWDKNLVTLTEDLTEARLKYLELINLELDILAPFFFNSDIKIRLFYIKGWSENLSYDLALEQSLLADMNRGFTQVGLNKSDIKISVCIKENNRIDAKEYLSKGNKKILSILLIIIQTKIFTDRNPHIRPTLLIDDLFSELDRINLNKIIKLISELNIQTFISFIENPENFNHQMVNEITNKDIKLFHVKHGVIREKALTDI